MKNGWFILMFIIGPSGLWGQTLAELERMALSAPQVRGAEKEVSIRQAEVEQTRQWGDLQIAGSAFASPIQTRTGQQIANFSVMQPLPWPGEQRAEKESTMGRVEAAQARVALTQAEQVYQVRLAWLALVDWQQSVTAQEAKVTNLQAWVRWLESRYEAGEAKLTEVMAQQTRLRMAEGQLQRLKWEQNRLHAALEQAVGSNLDSLQVPTGLGEVPVLPLGAKNWETTPWYARRAGELDALSAQEKVILWQSRPHVALGTQYGIITPYAEGPEVDNGRDIWMLPQLKVSIPLFFQTTKYELTALEAQYQQVESEYDAQQWAWKTEWTQAQEGYGKGEAIRQEAQSLMELLEQQKRLLATELLQDAQATGAMLQAEEALIEVHWRYQQGLSKQWMAYWQASYLLADSSQDQ
ncbi:MAG TPA: hypothetical protein DCE41_20795 [Cytophagales bacterium]|nr:hypothetical protein [Cytophagales bacterium]HAP62244.1 hypothetical protein [Cytophagales bacterium]